MFLCPTALPGAKPEIPEPLSALLEEQDKMLREVETLLAPLVVEAARVLARDERRRARRQVWLRRVGFLVTSLGYRRVRGAWLGLWSWCFGGKGLKSPTNVKVHTPLPASASDETGVKP